MTNTLLTAGVACVIAAIVGGGLRAFGLEIPVLGSLARQRLLAAFGGMLLLGAIVSREPPPPKPVTPPVVPKPVPSPEPVPGPRARLPDDTPLTRSNIVEILVGLGFTDIHVATEMGYVVDALRQNGVGTKGELEALANDRYVIGKLKQIYVEELKREQNFPLDAVAVAMYGSFLLKHDATDEAVEAVRQAIRQSAEYRRVHEGAPVPP